MSPLPEQDLSRYPLVHPTERLEFAAFKVGLATGFVMGFGAGFIVIVAVMAVFS